MYIKYGCIGRQSVENQTPIYWDSGRKIDSNHMTFLVTGNKIYTDQKVSNQQLCQSGVCHLYLLIRDLHYRKMRAVDNLHDSVTVVNTTEGVPTSERFEMAVSLLTALKWERHN